MMGLVLAKCLAALMNLRASVMPSTYMSMLFGFGVSAKVVYKVAEVHVNHGADGDEVAESNVFMDCPVKNGRA